MAKTPNYNYSNYSLEELYRVTQDIDRNTNPDAYAAAVKEIVRKQKQRDSSQGGSILSPADSSDGEIHSNPAGMIGALIGAGCSVVWMNLYPTTTPFYGQNFEPIVVEVGMILLGICIGALVGACAGMFKADSHR